MQTALRAACNRFSPSTLLPKNMKIAMSLLLLMCAISPPAVGAGEGDEAEIRAMVLFILDVETYKGMFYSVHDFCGPKTNRVVAEQSQRQWTKANKGLLAAQNMEEQKYLTRMRERGLEVEAELKLKEIKSTTFTKAHDHNRLYKDLLPLEDKHTACSKRLGVMNSDSMSFKSIAPDSYKYWRLHYEP